MNLTKQDIITVSRDSESAHATLTEIFNNIEDLQRENAMLKEQIKQFKSNIKESLIVDNFKLSYRDSRGIEYKLQENISNDYFTILILKGIKDETIQHSKTCCEAKRNYNF